MSDLYWAENAYLADGFATGVLIGVQDGRFASISPGHRRPGSADSITVLDGLVLPGLANAHSHAFHRALRGRTHGDGGTFWTWRERMYSLAGRLTPENYGRLATAVYSEMALAGITCVGEFHYVHHRPDGSPYEDPNAFGWALRNAARAAGIRLTLLDTCYLAGGLSSAGHTPLAPEQVRFGDGDADGWARRVQAMYDDPRWGDTARPGAAIHSVRAVPADQLPRIVAETRSANLPLHVHLSEQPAENEVALAHYGRTPTELLADAGALGSSSTVVHATHLTDGDIAALGSGQTFVCACPTTEADLADGIGPMPELAAAGARLCLGSDQHAHTDLLEEARRLEQHERLRSGRRGTFAPAELIELATQPGHLSLGWSDAGSIAVGQRADLVGVRLTSPRTAGCLPEQAVLSATADDVHTVIVDGAPVVRDGRHRLGDVGALLSDAITELWEDA